MVVKWEGEAAHGAHGWEREDKLAAKARGQITQSQKAKHLNRRDCLSQPKLGHCSCHELLVSLPFTGTFNS